MIKDSETDTTHFTTFNTVTQVTVIKQDTR